MTTCECGQPATEVCYRRGSAEEIWFCASRRHTPRVRELAAQGWMSQSATTAASPMGTAIRRRMQAA
jgi:hypothetical protein